MEGGGDPVEVSRGAAGSRSQAGEVINPAILPMSNTICANLEFLKGFQRHFPWGSPFVLSLNHVHS